LNFARKVPHILFAIARFSQYSKGAFHYAKDSRNFGRSSNGKVRFRFSRPEYSGSPLEVVHYFGRNIPTEIRRQVQYLTNWLFALITEMGRAIPIDWHGLIAKSRFIFLGYSH